MPREIADEVASFIAAMPKAEIHIHLEGAIPIETLYSFARRTGAGSGVGTLADLKRRLAYRDFSHFIEMWTWKNTFITGYADFEVMAYEVLRSLSGQNIRYVEAHYSPGDYRRQGLETAGITESILAGAERAGEDFGIGCGLILDLVRDHGPDIGMLRLEEATPYLGRGVVAVGLGGSEHDFPPGVYAPVYREARRRGFHLTAHAGEAAGPGSILEAVEALDVERIGHGVRAHEDPEVIALLRARGIPLEMCIVSNLRTGVVASVDDHPVRSYFDQGLFVTVNSDDPVMFNTTLEDEYLALAGDLGFSLDEIKEIALNAVRASFLPAEAKRLMLAEFESDMAGSQ
jgi:adenosine deaminase